LFRGALDTAVVAAQSDADAERFRLLGAPDVRMLGNLKFDIQISDAARAAGGAWRREFADRFVWVAGSTHEGEEQAALDAHRELRRQQSDALLVLVPRHPQRFAAVRGLLERSGERFVARSAGMPAGPDVAVMLVDTLGELLDFYAAADLAFVGGSLVPVGGHNLLEPAALGVAPLCGPFMSSAQDVAELFLAQGAVVQVASPQALADQVCVLAAQASRRSELGQAALRLVAVNRGVLDKTLELIAAIVPPA
jgi:3-deoxy-D-manno-octulosonic-acid transferase